MNPQAFSGYVCLLCFSFLSTAKGDLQLLSFQPGTLYRYRYSLDVQLDHTSTPSPPGTWLRAEALVKLHRLWRDQGGEELLQVQIHDLKAQQESEEERSQDGTGSPPAEIALSQEAQAELQQPVFISWSSGKVKAFYGDEGESILISNLKRGVVSLLQLQPHAGTAVEIFGVEWQPTSKSQYTVKDNLLHSVLAEESHMVSPALRSSIGIKISSRQQLQLLSPPMPGPAEVAGRSLEDALAGTEGRHQPLGMASLPFRRVCTRCPSLRAYLKAFDSQRLKTDTSKAATTWQFQRFIQMLRSAKKRDVLQLLRRTPEEMLPFVVEAAVAAQSVASLAALSDFLDFGKEPKSLLEKFLYAAAFSPRPSGDLLRLVLDKLDGKQLAPEVWETGIVAVGSLVGKLCQQKLCELQVKRAMRRIFHEKRKSYEKTCRLAAAEILLDNEPSPMDVINILLAANEMETETATFLLLKVRDSLRADHHHPARKIMRDIMKDPRINNYNFFSKAGISSSFSGPLTVTQDLLSTFGLDLLFLEGGFLRKSVSDFSLLSHGRRLHAAQVTIEAQGMESMLGENVLEGEEEPELVAGMSAIFFDVQLRPIVFFQGYTDLMAKVLLSSGEPTSVVKGNLLLMDHHQVIPLQSGLQVAIKLQGGLGLDISADMDVSIWEQELKTSINARGSLAIDFQAELDAPFLQATLRSQTEVETSIHFDTTLRFSSSPVLMCLQLREEQVPYREIFTVSKSAGNQSSTARKGRKGTVPGREFALHRANSKVCNLLMTAEE
ncbi:microsomal triglyceride transfer protein-like [Grus japonensis]|uniref:Microsomal triglyceride transfer protein-like n=1 Tax=Grus japonensis TaxID=30415 RepID=A0ABC9X474_GRUJA